MGHYIHYRIPKINLSVGSLLIAFTYVAVNIACAFLSKDYMRNFGDLVSANALLVTLPATRNSVLVYLLGIPFDKTIMYHRWLGRWTFILLCVHVFWAFNEWNTLGID